MIKKKKALSPVIATALLVAIALVLAVIIFLWARTFIGEGLEKEGRTIEQSCEIVAFNAEAFYGNNQDDKKVEIENLGNVAIYGVEIKTVDTAAGTEISQAENFQNTITIGGTGSVDLPPGIAKDDTLIIIPILLGERGTQTGTHKCDEDYGKEIIVKSA